MVFSGEVPRARARPLESRQEHWSFDPCSMVRTPGVVVPLLQGTGLATAEPSGPFLPLFAATRSPIGAWCPAAICAVSLAGVRYGHSGRGRVPPHEFRAITRKKLAPQ